MLGLAALFFTQSLFAAPADTGVPVENEIQRLELASARETLDPASRKKLAELYFLTSRCVEIKDLLFLYPKLLPEVAAACADGVGALKPEQTETLPGRALRLRTLIEAGKSECDVEVAGLITKLGGRPEAKAALLKGMRSRLKSGWIPDRASAAHMKELETSLAALEIK